MPGSSSPPAPVDAVVVGAGFAGLYAMYRLRGLGLAVRGFEQGGGVGGTWYWNRYPGARCDIESVQYSYSFSAELEQEWEWSERYPSQPELLRYLDHVADRFDLRRAFQFGTRVCAARFEEASGLWLLRTERNGQQLGEEVAARYLVMATGCLSSVRLPDYPGIDTFSGAVHHTARWPDEPVDFTGQRVGVVGTGSSGIQVIPVLAEQAAHLTVFQRTPNFSMPARNAPLDRAYQRQIKAGYPELRRQARETPFGVLFPTNQNSEKPALAVTEAERQREYEARWAHGGLSMFWSFADLMTDKAANDSAAEFVRAKIRQIVRDPALARMLLPTSHPIGTKRPCLDTGYYATYNRDNVSLVDIRSAPIEEVTPHGIRTREAVYPLDSIVFATGFDAMTGALLDIDIQGRDGQPLARHWAGGPRTYLGIATAGFPNLFLITGPGSPSVLSNMVASVEQHVDWIAGCLQHLRAHGLDRVEPTAQAEHAWTTHVAQVAAYTLYPTAQSWYVGANVPGKPRVFMPYIGGAAAYRQRCDAEAAAGYKGFTLTASKNPAGPPPPPR